MTVEIKVERISKVFINLVKTLEKFKVIKMDYSEDDGKIISYEVLDEKVFLEVGFGIFLGWFYNSKCEKIKGGQFNFINLGDRNTFFLWKTPTVPSINHYTPNKYIKEMFNSIPSGNNRHNLCPLYHFLKYNFGCLDEETCDLGIPTPSDGCHVHKEKTKKWIINKIKEDETYGKVFGGDGCLLHATPEIFEILFTEARSKTSASDPTEELFNSFLALYVASLHEFDVVAVNTPLTSPVRSNELDVFLWDNKEGNLVVLETTGEYNIDGDHLKRKIYSAAVLNTLGIPKYGYKYLTIGCADDIKGNFSHVILYESLVEKYGVAFDLIALPTIFNEIKEKRNRFDPKKFRKIYRHYLGELNESVGATLETELVAT